MAFTDDRYYTTTQLATLLKLDRKTIIDLFDAGYLRGHRLPASRWRKVTRKSAHDLMRRLGVEPPPETPREP